MGEAVIRGRDVGGAVLGVQDMGRVVVQQRLQHLKVFEVKT